MKRSIINAMSLAIMSLSSSLSTAQTINSAVNVPTIPGAKVLCVNGGDTAGAHDSTWKKLNTDAGAANTWKRVGECISTPSPAPAPVPVPVPVPPPVPVPVQVPPSALPSITCAPDSWINSSMTCPAGYTGNIVNVTEVTCPAGPYGAPFVRTGDVNSCVLTPLPAVPVPDPVQPFPSPAPACPPDQNYCDIWGGSDGGLASAPPQDYGIIKYSGATCAPTYIPLGTYAPVNGCPYSAPPTCTDPSAPGQNGDNNFCVP